MPVGIPFASVEGILTNNVAGHVMNAVEKKKILFAINELNVGGVEKSLLSLFGAIPRDRYEIHLALMQPGGGFESFVPADVTVHQIGGYMRVRDFMRSRSRGLLKGLKSGNIASTIKMLAVYLRSRLSGTLLPFFDYAIGDEIAAGGMEFDLAVNYAGPSEFLDCYITRHTCARRRAVWIHFDLERTFDRVSTSRLTHGSYDRVFCVSPHALDVYRRRYPEFAGHAALFRNIIDEKSILADSSAGSDYAPAPAPVLNVVTVARLNPEKGIDLALKSLRVLLDSGTDACWHFIGGGELAPRYRAMADSLGLADRVRFYGPRTNPFPYMAGADVYVQPSLHEGFGITVAEALCFDAPIAVTPFDCAAEQLGDGRRDNAVIAAGFEPEQLADAVLSASRLPRGRSGKVAGRNSDINKLIELL